MATGRFLQRSPKKAIDEDTSDDELEAETLASPTASAKAAAENKAKESSEEAEDYELLEKVKTTAQNGTGKATRRNKKSAKGR